MKLTLTLTKNNSRTKMISLQIIKSNKTVSQNNICKSKLRTTLPYRPFLITKIKNITKRNLFPPSIYWTIAFIASDLLKQLNNSERNMHLWSRKGVFSKKGRRWRPPPLSRCSAASLTLTLSYAEPVIPL